MQIVVELLRLGDVWTLGIARNPMFSRAWWIPASMWGTLSVRRVRLVRGDHFGFAWLSPLCHCKGDFQEGQ